MEEKIRVYIDRKFKTVFKAFWLLITLYLTFGASSYILHRDIGRIDTTVTYLKNANYVEREYFELYMEKLGNLIIAHENLCNAVRNDDLARVEHIENDIREIKLDIKTLGNKLGLQTRSGTNTNN